MTYTAPEEYIDGRPASDLTAELPDRISSAMRDWARCQPETLALVDPEVRWTYVELDAAVARTREWLHTLGVRGGDRIMLVSENGRALLALLLAASDLDAWAAIINARLSGPEIGHIRDNCQPRRVFYTVGVSPAAAEHAQRNDAERCTFEPLGELAVGALDEDSRPEPVATDGASQVAALIYTSGTTGAPKGVMLTHRNLLYVARVAGGLRGLAPGKRVYAVLPTAHVFGLAAVTIGALANGACLYTAPRFTPEHLITALERDAVQIVPGVPAMFARTLEHLQQTGHTLNPPPIDFMSAGGAPLDMDLKRRAEAVFGSTLHNGYGLTECSATATLTRMGEQHDCNTVGKLLPGMAADIRTTEGQPVADGKVGELWLRGPNVTPGYFRRPEATAEVLTADGWYNSGDLARFGDDRNLFIVGRSKELIIRSGFNVYPPDVEAVLSEHPEVTLSAVVGRNVENNEEVVAFVQRVPGSTLTADALQAFAAERLSGYKRPSTIVFMDALPATATGKILKGQLKDRIPETTGA